MDRKKALKMVEEGLIKGQCYGLCLFWSCRREYTEVSKALFAHGKNLKLGDFNGEFPLHYACTRPDDYLLGKLLS
jgi:hypothetical protein